MDRPVNRVTVASTPRCPRAASVEVDVEPDGRRNLDRVAAGGVRHPRPVELPRDVVDVQAWLTLWSAGGGAAAVVSPDA